MPKRPHPGPALAAFNHRLTAILGRPVPIGLDGTLTPQTLEFSPEAKAGWIAFHDAVELEVRAGGDAHDVGDVASKTADNAARLAALFEIFEQQVGPVSPSAFDSASRIAAWHLHEARRFFGELAL